MNVVVDKKEYRLFGQYWIGEGNATQTAVEFTATRTTFIMDAGGVRFNMSFLNPIEVSLLVYPFRRSLTLVRQKILLFSLSLSCISQ